MNPAPKRRADKLFGLLDSAFLKVRSFADWTFKGVTWLIVIATLRYAFEITGNPHFGVAYVALYILASAVLFLFLLRAFDRKPSDTVSGLLIFGIIGIIASASVYMALSLMSSMVDALIDFQKSARPH